MSRYFDIPANVGVSATARLVGLVAGAYGVVYGLGGAVVDTLVALGRVTTDETPGLSLGTALALLAIPIMPVLFAVGGIILGAVGVDLYNSFARLTVDAVRHRKRPGSGRSEN